MPPTFCDSHAHLNDEQFDGDLPEVLARSRQAGITRVINVGYDVASSVKALEQATAHDMLFCTVGLHPHDAKKFEPVLIDFFDSLAADPKVVAIGETGLDRYYNHSPFEVQVEAFEAHLELAESLRLPAVIHCRDAYPELCGLLEKKFTPAHSPWQVHCFSGEAEDLERLIAVDCYFSIGGSATFRNFKGQALIARIPADRLLLETDCPYLAPVPKRGKRNEPAYLALSAEVVAGMRGVSLEELSRVTSENFTRIFGG
ncbi:MAG TPA: TatD family hydrolase [Candidatus Glassbacteria bacterium]|nr:TatD family hydrolase [Candidatus Glassbacteria bacterium]